MPLASFIVNQSLLGRGKELQGSKQLIHASHFRKPNISKLDSHNGISNKYDPG